MTLVRHNLNHAEARAFLKSELWKQHQLHLRDADRALVAEYVLFLVILSEWRYDIPNATYPELAKCLSVLTDSCAKNINGEKS